MTILMQFDEPLQFERKAGFGATCGLFLQDVALLFTGWEVSMRGKQLAKLGNPFRNGLLVFIFHANFRSQAK